MQVNTERLLLTPVTYRQAVSIIAGSNTELENMGIEAAPGWPTNDTRDILGMIAENPEENTEPNGFNVWFIIRKDGMAVIGDAGFKGEPDMDGSIEIGYGLVEGEWGKGFGYEAAKGLIDWAFKQEGVKKVKADCLVENIASQRVLQKLSMRETGRDKDLIYWELIKNS